MSWVTFARDFEFRPRRCVILVFRAGQRRLVPRTIASAARAAGALQEAPPDAQADRPADGAS